MDVEQTTRRRKRQQSNLRRKNVDGNDGRITRKVLVLDRKGGIGKHQQVQTIDLAKDRATAGRQALESSLAFVNIQTWDGTGVNRPHILRIRKPRYILRGRRNESSRRSRVLLLYPAQPVKRSFSEHGQIIHVCYYTCVTRNTNQDEYENKITSLSVCIWQERKPLSKSVNNP